MYECPNCAADLKFSIDRQQLYCDYCGTQVDPYSFYKEKDAEEIRVPSDGYEVTVFTCPQCGGEIISEDTTAATFCSFCGGSTILDSRIRKERRPVHIIPFTKTKEDCRAAYGELLRRAIFAPKELKDETLIEKFRGIYMPYWVYSFKRQGPVTFSGQKTYRRGDYKITDHYKVDCDVDAVYEGLAYDASSTFSDSLSSAIAPFHLTEGKPFVPSFLCGFYADTSDVESDIYRKEAEEVVIQDTSRCLLDTPGARGYQIVQKDALMEELRPSARTVELAMLPVWFLSYRNGDRVSYAVVNGQTGKAVADLPIDGKRYLAGSVLLAIPLFFLLNCFLTVTPGKVLLAAVLSALACMLILNGQLSRIAARESGEDDKGLMSMRLASEMSGPKGPGPEDPGSKDPGPEDLGLKDPGPEGMAGIRVPREGDAGSGKETTALDGRKRWPVLLKPLAGIAAAAAIWIWGPVEDWFYYIGALLCMAAVLWAIMDIIRQHAMLTTRKLPQLNRRGGDEGA